MENGKVAFETYCSCAYELPMDGDIPRPWNRLDYNFKIAWIKVYEACIKKFKQNEDEVIMSVNYNSPGGEVMSASYNFPSHTIKDELDYKY